MGSLAARAHDGSRRDKNDPRNRQIEMIEREEEDDDRPLLA